MTSTSFTYRKDPDLRAELERIARFEDRSASDVADLAIRSFVEERNATRELVREGLRQVAADAPALTPEDVRQWLLGPEETPFPAGRKIT
jgi:predicted transcriptional regulator